MKEGFLDCFESVVVVVSVVRVSEVLGFDEGREGIIRKKSRLSVEYLDQEHLALCHHHLTILSLGLAGIDC